MSAYHEIFEGWEDVQREFGIEEPEPEVMFAAYEYENYSGDCLVLFKRDNTLWLVEGSHCSCDGLEGQWIPEEITPAVLRQITKEIVEEDEAGDEWSRPDDLRYRYREALLKVCDLLEPVS